MFRANGEPTIDEILRDPTVRALMRADRVDAAEFETRLRGGFAGARRRESATFGASRREPFGGRFPHAPGMPAAPAAHRCGC
jgi:hypothetical protein